MHCIRLPPFRGERLGAVGAHTVGFAAHVDEELMAAASAAGCDEVLARSVFFRRFPDFVS